MLFFAVQPAGGDGDDLFKPQVTEETLFQQQGAVGGGGGGGGEDDGERGFKFAEGLQFSAFSLSQSL